MSANLFTTVTYPASLLIEKIDLGEIGLPDIQRPFVWKAARVRDLLDSMYRGFPVGYLLFWENPVVDNPKAIGTDQKQRPPSSLIIDGQQRLTSLYAVFKGKEVTWEDYSRSRIQIAFRPTDAKFEVADAAIRKDPEWIPDVSVLWAKATSLRKFINTYIDTLQSAKPDLVLDEDQIDERISDLQRLADYTFSVLVLSANVDEEQAAEIFVRINSKAVPLGQADFILTLMSVFWDEGRAKLEAFCRSAAVPPNGAPSPYNHFIKPQPDELLRVSVGLGFKRARLGHVYSILRGKDLATGQISVALRNQNFATLQDAQAYVLNLQNWQEFMKVLMSAGFMSESMISSKMALLYTYVLYLIGKRDYKVDPNDLRNVMARWFFMASITGRYTSNSEAQLENDLARIRSTDAAGFVQTLEKVIGDTLTNDFWSITLPNDLATSTSRSPSLYAYCAALNLLDARVLFSNLKVQSLLDPAIRGTRSAIEKHHLFPKKYLAKNGITDTRESNQIANYALVEWTDNVDISDQAPADYLPRYMPRFTPEMAHWHALPQGWEQMAYPAFLEARRQLMAQVIRDGFAKL